MTLQPRPAPSDFHSRDSPAAAPHSCATSSPADKPRPLVGRDDDIAHLVMVACRPGTRVLMITGPAGVGKTALAQHLAFHLREHCPDSHAFVLIADDVSRMDEISSFPSVNDDSLLIATSRNSLPANENGVHQHVLAALAPQDATALATSIIRATRAFDPPEQVHHLAMLCARLPMALWLAAGRAAARPLMPLAAIIEDLRAESTPWLALTAGTEHHDETLQAVLTSCYNALPASLARAARLLASHPGPGFPAALARVVLGGPAGQVNAALHALEAAHWVESPRPGRYRLPTAAREFAAGQAEIEEKPDDLRHLVERVARWYLSTAIAVAGEVHASSDARHVMNCWLADERINLLAVIEATRAYQLPELMEDLSQALHALTGLVNFN